MAFYRYVVSSPQYWDIISLPLQMLVTSSKIFLSKTQPNVLQSLKYSHIPGSPDSMHRVLPLPHSHSRHLPCSCPAPSTLPHRLRPTPPSSAHRLNSIHQLLPLQMTIRRTTRTLSTFSQGKGTTTTTNHPLFIAALARALSEK